MKKLVPFLALLIAAVLPSPSYAWVAQVPAAAASYTGDGDIAGTNFLAWYSCGLAYNAAYATAGGKTCNVCTYIATVEANCTDLVASTNGTVTVPLLGGNSCSVVTCLVKIAYDQLGYATSGGNCGGSPCDETNATPANQPVLTLSAQNGLPGITCTAANSTYLKSASTFSGTATQPFTVSWVAKFTGTAGAYNNVFGSRNGAPVDVETGFGNLANIIFGYAGAVLPVGFSTPDGSFYAVQNILHGASPNSNTYVNGTGTPGSAGSSTLGTNFSVCADYDVAAAAFLTGVVLQWGVATGAWSVAGGSTSALVNANQRSATHWNF